MRMLVALLVTLLALGCGEGGSKSGQWSAPTPVVAPAAESTPVWSYPKELPLPKAERSPGNERTPIPAPAREEVRRDGEMIPPPPSAVEETIPAPKKDQ